jgi:hypothetical protein
LSSLNRSLHQIVLFYRDLFLDKFLLNKLSSWESWRH